MAAADSARVESPAAAGAGIAPTLAELVALRSNNNGATLAAMLEATSLAVQPDLRANLSARTFAFYYLCGERDSKFRALAAELAADCHVIPRAGHNAHRENPAGVIASLAQILRF